MSEQKDGGPAFAPGDEVTRAFPGREYDSRPWWPGMSLRDYFAAKALTGIVQAHYETPPGEEPLQPEDVARDCYLFADAMLAARAK